MQPLVFELKAPREIHDFFLAYRPDPPTGWWFRGQSDSSWPLIPKAGRPEYRLKGGRSLGRFRAWSQKAIGYEPNLPKNDWEKLAVAQHYGLATCLLDWTHNPLVGLFFACRENLETEGALFCFAPEMYISESAELKEEAEVPGFGYIPRWINARVLNQRSIFSVHIPPTTNVEVKQHEAFKKEHPNLVILKIPSAHKIELLSMLDDYGINDTSIFPDLGGLSSYINWITKTKIVSKLR